MANINWTTLVFGTVLGVLHSFADFEVSEIDPDNYTFVLNTKFGKYNMFLTPARDDNE